MCKMTPSNFPCFLSSIAFTINAASYSNVIIGACGLCFSMIKSISVKEDISIFGSNQVKFPAVNERLLLISQALLPNFRTEHQPVPDGWGRRYSLRLCQGLQLFPGEDV